MKQGLALFDFDGTLTTQDSLLEFIKYSCGSFRYYLVMALFSPVIFYHTVISKDGEQAKQRLLSFLFKGLKESELESLGAAFAEKVLPKIERAEMMDVLRDMKKHGYRIVVISASISIWLKPWTDSLGVELISTEFEFKNGTFTGRFATPNCNGTEKVARIKKHLNVMDYSPIYAYGNSKGDLPMLALADFPFMNNLPLEK
ncbi:MAG: HAD family hydrolase [Cyclobacteriaceae bacterium]|nr:HAD family hydrolase [Cyclobacteriaceae bacterium]